MQPSAVYLSTRARWLVTAQTVRCCMRLLIRGANSIPIKGINAKIMTGIPPWQITQSKALTQNAPKSTKKPAGEAQGSGTGCPTQSSCSSSKRLSFNLCWQAGERLVSQRFIGVSGLSQAGPCSRNLSNQKSNIQHQKKPPPQGKSTGVAQVESDQ